VSTIGGVDRRAAAIRAASIAGARRGKFNANRNVSCDGNFVVSGAFWKYLVHDNFLGCMD
jgi:hypothetical protein